MVETILIKIASYRDKGLVKTINDAIKKASCPQRLRFAVVNQYCEDTKLDHNKIPEDIVIRETNVPWNLTKGVGWARDLTDRLFQDEDFFLQIDAHSRFDYGWDELLISDWKSRKNPNVVFSTMPGPFRVEDGQGVLIQTKPTMLFATGFDPFYIIDMLPVPGTDPFKSKGLFIAANFVFGPGAVIKDCLYPVEASYYGEELMYALTLFTHGYDIFQPKTVPVYHFYCKPEELGHTVTLDLQEEGLAEKATEMNRKAVKSAFRLLFGTAGSRYIGTKRTRQEFFSYLKENLLASPWPKEWPLSVLG